MTKPARSAPPRSGPNAAGTPIDARIHHAGLRARLVEPLDREELALRRNEEADAGPAPPTPAGNLDGLAERRRDRESVQIDPERGVTDLSVVSSAEPGSDLHDLRPLRPDPDLCV